LCTGEREWLVFAAFDVFSVEEGTGAAAAVQADTMMLLYVS